MAEFFIPLRMPSWNEAIDASNASPFKYNAMKQKWGHVTALFARQAGLPKVDGPRHFEYEFHEPNRRRDPSNMLAAVKFIEDGLQAAGILPKDNWDYVSSIAVTWKVSEKPGVLVRLL